MNSFLLYINYPSWIRPEIFPGVPVLGLIRWYGLMYVFAFTTAFFVLRQEMREGALDSGESKATDDDIFSFIAWGIVFLLIGARVFSCLVYDTSGEYLKMPWLIFWPFYKEVYGACRHVLPRRFYRRLHRAAAILHCAQEAALEVD